LASFIVDDSRSSFVDSEFESDSDSDSKSTNQSDEMWSLEDININHSAAICSDSENSENVKVYKHCGRRKITEH
jgi:hypothetical protein